MTQTLRTRKGGLDWTVPQNGAAADAYAVARTATFLHERRTLENNQSTARAAASHATRLHVIAGRLWTIAEREANGYRIRTVENLIHGGATHDASAEARDMKRKASLEADAMEIAAHYGLSCSFGGLVDGGLVIGTPDQLNRVDPERHGHVVRRLGR